MIQWEGMGAEVNDGETCMTYMCNLIILVLYIFKIFHNEKFENSRKKKRERKKGWRKDGRKESYEPYKERNQYSPPTSINNISSFW